LHKSIYRERQKRRQDPHKKVHTLSLTPVRNREMEIEKKVKDSEEMGGEKEEKKNEARRGGIRTLPFILGQ